jgi:ABC-type lipoprotein release transport system permease subunit
MGRVILVGRLVMRDLQRRPGEAVMLLLAIVAATTTLTLGLILHGETDHPYEQTRAATKGPDAVASVFPVGSLQTAPGSPNDSGGSGAVTAGQLKALGILSNARGVVAHSGPYPVTWTALRSHGLRTGAEVEGRDVALAVVDQPKVTDGTWVRNGGAVVEREFAEALGVRPGDSITLGGRVFEVVGLAVTAAFTPYPQVCSDGCDLNTAQLAGTSPGLIWLTRSDAQSLVTPAEPPAYFLNLKLAHPSAAETFGNAYDSPNESLRAPFVEPWQQISQQDGNLVKNEQRIMLISAWLLGFLALASVAVLVGGRMAEQIRRVGLLKAVGGTPGLIAGVLLAQYVVLALAAGATGILVGRLVAPLFGATGAGLLGTVGAPTVTVDNVAVVLVVALAVAVLAAIVPAVRAARTSTVHALADAARVPRRRAWLIALSGRLPASLLIGMRVAARRPRRVILGVLSIAVTVSGIVAVLYAHTSLDASQSGSVSGLVNPRTQSADQVLLLVTMLLVALAAVNALFITRAMVQDSKHSSAVTRALGATPDQIAVGLASAQVLPGLLGALLGIPGGSALYAAVKHGSTTVVPPLWWFVALVVGTVVAVTFLTSIPALSAARRSVAEILQSEVA